MTNTRDKVCRMCGSAIPAAPFSQTGGDYCCESCFLSPQGTLHTTAAIQAEAAFAEALAAALDLREHETGLHSKRVACHTLELAQRSIPDDTGQLRQVYWGALLHDIGKIGITDAMLLKQGPLTDSEWGKMRTHPEMGYSIIAQVPGMREAADIVLCHEDASTAPAIRADSTGKPSPGVPACSP